MVVLKNLKKVNNMIEFDYFPEGESDYGHAVYDVDKKEVISKQLAKEDTEFEGIETYLSFAILRLERILEKQDYINGEFKDRYVAFWY